MSNLSPLGSCTHSVWEHFRHPLCPNLPRWQIASMVGIAGIALAGTYWLLTRDSSTDYRRYVNQKFIPGAEAFKNTLALRSNLSFAQLLAQQKQVLKGSISNNGHWLNSSGQSKAVLETAYVLATLALDECLAKGKKSLSDDAQAKLLDFFSLYHVIRSAGVFNADSYACSTHPGQQYCNEFYSRDLLMDDLRKLYNNMGQRFGAEGLTMPKEWPVFGEDKDAASYVCPLPYVDSVDVGPAVKTLENLLGKSLDEIPMWTEKECISVETMTAPIMKGVEGGMPFIAIGMNNPYNNKKWLFMLTHKNNKWFQIKYGDREVYPKFFIDGWSLTGNTPFTESDGQVIDNYSANFTLLQTLIRDGKGKDLENCNWELLR